MKKLHLPTSIADHEVAIKLRDYIEQMHEASIFMSTIVYHDGKTMRFLTRDKEFPFVEFDWLIYCVMRTHARTWITSGPNVRGEPRLFGDDRGSVGNPEILKLYEDNVHDLINIFVFTQNMARE